MTLARLQPLPPARLATTVDEVSVDDKNFGRIATVALLGNLVFIGAMLIAYFIRTALP